MIRERGVGPDHPAHDNTIVPIAHGRGVPSLRQHPFRIIAEGSAVARRQFVKFDRDVPRNDDVRQCPRAKIQSGRGSRGIDLERQHIVVEQCHVAVIVAHTPLCKVDGYAVAVGLDVEPRRLPRKGSPPAAGPAAVELDEPGHRPGKSLDPHLAFRRRRRFLDVRVALGKVAG
jgi:hypothetical protein